MLIQGTPPWLKKWTALICHFIHFEETNLPKNLQKIFPLKT
jgi:hypothetical protein